MMDNQPQPFSPNQFHGYSKLHGLKEQFMVCLWKRYGIFMEDKRNITYHPLTQHIHTQMHTTHTDTHIEHVHMLHICINRYHQQIRGCGHGSSLIFPGGYPVSGNSGVCLYGSCVCALYVCMYVWFSAYILHFHVTLPRSADKYTEFCISRTTRHFSFADTSFSLCRRRFIAALWRALPHSAGAARYRVQTSTLRSEWLLYTPHKTHIRTYTPTHLHRHTQKNIFAPSNTPLKKYKPARRLRTTCPCPEAMLTEYWIQLTKLRQKLTSLTRKLGTCTIPQGNLIALLL